VLTYDEQLAAFLGSPEIAEQLKQLDQPHIEVQAARKIELFRCGRDGGDRSTC
jgi:hypothetical protein